MDGEPIATFHDIGCRVCWREHETGAEYRSQPRYTRDQALAVVAILEERLSRWARHWVEPLPKPERLF